MNKKKSQNLNENIIHQHRIECRRLNFSGQILKRSKIYLYKTREKFWYSSAYQSQLNIMKGSLWNYWTKKPSIASYSKTKLSVKNISHQRFWEWWNSKSWKNWTLKSRIQFLKSKITQSNTQEYKNSFNSNYTLTDFWLRLQISSTSLSIKSQIKFIKQANIFLCYFFWHATRKLSFSTFLSSCQPQSTWVSK